MAAFCHLLCFSLILFSVCVYVSLSLSLSPFLCLSLYLSLSLTISSLPLSLSLSLSVSFSICLSLSVFLYLPLLSLSLSLSFSLSLSLTVSLILSFSWWSVNMCTTLTIPVLFPPPGYLPCLWWRLPEWDSTGEGDVDRTDEHPDRGSEWGGGQSHGVPGNRQSQTDRKIDR